MAAQKKIKTPLEEIIPKYITDEKMRKVALDFAEWLRLNKLTPGQYGINRWKASNKGKGICFMVLGNNIWKKHDSWVIRLDLTNIKEYESAIMNEGLNEFVWNNIHHCWHCCIVCAPGLDMTLMGREYQGLCKTVILYSGDPGEAELNAIKKLLELEKQARGARGRK
ncbi:MAG: hypothetical protein FWC78_03850 [Defluviitaleaceae bacterium]|nr:hypothetical protein [Defluviitaleaceae bacterium]